MTRKPDPPVDLITLISSSRVLSDNTKRGYTTAVTRWLKFAGDSPKGWTPQAARAFYDSLLTGPDKVKTKTANTIMWGVRYALHWWSKGIPNTTNPIDAIELGRVRSTDEDVKQTPLTYDQGRALVEACHGNDIIDQRDRAMVVLGLFTGMRRSSLIDIKLEHVRIEQEVVFLTITIKGGNRYAVPIHPQVWGLTSRYRAMLALSKGPLFRSFKQTMNRGQRTVGDSLTADGAYKALVGRANAASIEGFHPHLLRHTLVSWCLEAGMVTDRIEVITGHKGNQALARRVYGNDAFLAPAVVQDVWNAIAPKLGLG